VLFTDIPRNYILKWNPEGDPASSIGGTTKVGSVSIFKEESQGANGLLIDSEGRLVVCLQGGRSVVRFAKDGSGPEVLADSFNGKKLSSPNDLTMGRDGLLWFTDPPFGLPKQTEGREQEFDGVYRLDKEGKPQLMIKNLKRPNGIGIAPSGKRVYVGDTATAKIYVHYLDTKGNIGASDEFADVKENVPHSYTGWVDGLKVAPDGTILTSAPGGIQCYHPNGKLEAVVRTPEPATNCALGGKDGKTLYITAGKSLYRATLNSLISDSLKPYDREP
jgi:gluconolactonase